MADTQPPPNVINYQLLTILRKNYFKLRTCCKFLYFFSCFIPCQCKLCHFIGNTLNTFYWFLAVLPPIINISHCITICKKYGYIIRVKYLLLMHFWNFMILVSQLFYLNFIMQFVYRALNYISWLHIGRRETRVRRRPGQETKIAPFFLLDIFKAKGWPLFASKKTKKKTKTSKQNKNKDKSTNRNIATQDKSKSHLERTAQRKKLTIWKARTFDVF